MKLTKIPRILYLIFCTLNIKCFRRDKHDVKLLMTQLTGLPGPKRQNLVTSFFSNPLKMRKNVEF
jgi:hypothetical protein